MINVSCDRCLLALLAMMGIRRRLVLPADWYSCYTSSWWRAAHPDVHSRDDGAAAAIAWPTVCHWCRWDPPRPSIKREEGSVAIQKYSPARILPARPHDRQRRADPSRWDPTTQRPFPGSDANWAANGMRERQHAVCPNDRSPPPHPLHIWSNVQFPSTHDPRPRPWAHPVVRRSMAGKRVTDMMILQRS